MEKRKARIPNMALHQHPIVSVIVPVYNNERFVSPCVRSLIAQTLENIEIICINDGSTDRSPEILHQFAQSDPRVRVIDKENGGYGVAINRGLDEAQGKYVGILESDDFADPDMLETLVDRAEAFDLEVVRANFFNYWETKLKKDIPVYLIGEGECDRIINPYDRDSRHVFYIQPALWSAIYRTDFIRGNRLRLLETPGAAYQDTSFNFKIWACARRVMLVHKPFVHYRQDNESSSINNKSKVYNVVKEYHEIDRWLAEDRPDLRKELAPVMNSMRCDTYAWNEKRIAEEYKLDFVKQFGKELAAAQAAGEIDPSLFSPGKYWIMCKAITDPQGFIDFMDKGIDPDHGISRLARKAQTMRQVVRNRGVHGMTSVIHDKLNQQPRELSDIEKADIEAEKKAEREKAIEAGKAAVKAQNVPVTTAHSKPAQGNTAKDKAGRDEQASATSALTQNARDSIGAVPGEPLVSVIIPVFNASRFLVQRMDSLLCQTMRDLEVICVDDGSTDDSLEILNAYAAKDPRVRVVSQENAGPAVARNHGIALAKGKYLTSMDADDYCEADLFARVMDAIARNTANGAVVDVAIWPVIGHNERTGTDVRLYYSCMSQYFPRRVFTWKDNPDRILNCFQNWLHNKLFRTQFVRENGLHLENLHHTEDMLFTCSALVLAEGILCVEDASSYYRMGMPDSQFHSTAKYPLDFYHACCSLHDFLEERSLLVPIRVSYANWVADCVMTNIDYMKDSQGMRLIYQTMHDGGLERLGLTDVPDGDYFIDTFGPRLRHLTEDNYEEFLIFEHADAIKRLHESEEREAETANSLSAIEGSKSFRLGRAMTAPLRSLRDLSSSGR
jgi:glycosyltransferase involved in cell wall biosynthesis